MSSNNLSNSLIWPAQYSRIAVIFSIILILSIYMFFGSYIMPLSLLLFGFGIVVFFFWSFHYYSLKWSQISLNKFYKKLFWHSFVYRLIFVGIMYLLTYIWDPKSFPFEINAADSWLYHLGGVKISNEIFHENLIKVALKYFKGTSDVGFPIYTGFLYYIFGPLTLIVRIFNVIWGSITVIYISKITNSIFGKSSAKLSGIIAMLMPAFLWYGGMHLKETLMIFLIIAVFYNATNIVRKGKVSIIAISIMILFSFLLFFFRTFLAVLVIICLLSYFALNFFKKNINKSLIFISIMIFIIIVSNLITSYGFEEDISSTLEASKDRFNKELTSAAKQRGVSYKRTLVAPFLIAGSIVTPFPSLLGFEKRQLNIYVRFQNELVRNIMYFFAFLGIFYSLKYRFRESSLIALFGLGYISILAFAAVSFQARFQLPSLPFMIIFMSAGFNYSKGNLKEKWFIYLFFIFIAIFAWNYFKISIRGLA